METQRYYVSLQYSAIQKTVLRHDRLWHMAGTSHNLTKLNELLLPELVGCYSGSTLLAGGGKLTASFSWIKEAELARKEMAMLVAASFPMLEFQISPVVPAGDFLSALFDERRIDNRTYPGVVRDLKLQKNHFRGSAVTFNPHLQLCVECGCYPALDKEIVKKRLRLCRSCTAARTSAYNIRDLSSWFSNGKVPNSELTTLEKIYLGYFAQVENAALQKVPLDFEDLFPDDGPTSSAQSGTSRKKKRMRMAVWLSDINSMKNRIKVWLNQTEAPIKPTFDAVKQVYIDTVSEALASTFPGTRDRFMPFRIIVAGGDDLCIVMAEKYILRFAQNYSAALISQFKNLENEHPLSTEWLNKKACDLSTRKERPVKLKGGFGPYSFGGAFVVTSLHTRFSQIHAVGDNLLKEAKNKTDRRGNSVNWRVMAEEDKPEEKDHFKFDKPLLIERESLKEPQKQLCFNDYLELRNKHRKISGSHRQQIVSRIEQLARDVPQERLPEELENWLKEMNAAEQQKSFACFLSDPDFRLEGRSSAPLAVERILTLLELSALEG